MRALLVAGVLLALAAPARGQASDPDAEARAKVLFDEGTRHYDLAEYDQAIASYKEAYRLLPDPLFLFNIGQAYRQADDCTHARTFYKSYLRNAPDAYNREKVEKRIAEMEECIRATGAVPETDPPDPATDLTGPQVQPVPVPHPVPVPVPVPLPAPVTVAPAHAPAPPQRGRTRRLAGVITASVGAAMLGTGGYFSLRATDAARQVTTLCATSCEGDVIASLDAEGRADDRNAAILYGVGAAALVAGVTLYVWGRMEGREAPTMALVPSESGASVMGAWSW